MAIFGVRAAKRSSVTLRFRYYPGICYRRSFHYTSARQIHSTDNY